MQENKKNDRKNNDLEPGEKNLENRKDDSAVGEPAETGKMILQSGRLRKTGKVILQSGNMQSENGRRGHTDCSERSFWSFF